MYTHIHIYVYIYIYVSIYVYVLQKEKERKKEREGRDGYVYNREKCVYTHTCIHTERQRFLSLKKERFLPLYLTSQLKYKRKKQNKLKTYFKG